MDLLPMSKVQEYWMRQIGIERAKGSGKSSKALDKVLKYKKKRSKKYGNKVGNKAVKNQQKKRDQIQKVYKGK